MMSTVSVEEILRQVAEERDRQDAQWGKPAERGYGADMWLAVLGEEVGEVCAAVTEGGCGDMHGHDLRAELIQVAAVCGAWCEADGALHWLKAVRNTLIGGDVAREQRQHGLLVCVLTLLGRIAGARADTHTSRMWRMRLAAHAVQWAANLGPAERP